MCFSDLYMQILTINKFYFNCKNITAHLEAIMNYSFMNNFSNTDYVEFVI